jgi:CheY-like chemotaxis protein
VRIAVSDTGAGISSEALPHIFEPFFTTRQSGTGLGLAICYGIVKQSAGHIAVHSTLGRGTTFEVHLPRCDERAAGDSPSAPSVPPALVSEAGERVLIVEDEPAVRSLLERTLELASYRVVAASNGEEGLRIAVEQGPFDILITDAVMPGVSGWEVGKRLSSLWPKLRVLYISGYTEDAFGHGRTLDREVKFLQKPFTPSDLLSTLRRLGEP